jgi:RNA polymerase sigma-70 factor, ECF subfamily
MMDDTRVTRRGKAYFFGAAARAMRQVLVDYARRRKAEKRGGGVQLLSLDEGQVAVDEFAAELLDLDRALEQLAALNPATHGRSSAATSRG